MSDLAARIADLSPEKRALLERQLSRLRQGAATPSPFPLAEPRPDEQWEPFPMTDVQEVYWAGRSPYFDLGTPGICVYLEYRIQGRNGESFIASFERALERTFDRHGILRLRVLPDGRQQFVRNPPPFRIERINLQGLDPVAAEARLEEVRERFRYHRAAIGEWPLFGLIAHFLTGNVVQLHIWIDCWLIDGLSRDTLVHDIFEALDNPESPPVPTEITYRDYALTWEAIRRSDVYRRAREHWMRRIPDLPPAPELPLAVPLSPRVGSRLSTRFRSILTAEEWQAWKDQAARLGLTPSTPLIAAFLEVIRTWNRHPIFTLSLEGTYWPPIHPGIRTLVGNFNTIYLVAADDLAGGFAERSRRLQTQLTDILDHRTFSGFEVLREINRRRGGSPRALMPVLFNSLVEFNHRSYRDATQVPPPVDPSSPRRNLDMGLVEMGGRPPQLLLMPAVVEGADAILTWAFRAVEEVFRPGVTDGLEEAYVEYVRRLSREPKLWATPPPCLVPPAQLAGRAAAHMPLSIAAARDILGFTPEDRILALAPPSDGGPGDGFLRRLAERTSMRRTDASEASPEAAPFLRASVWCGSPAQIERLAARLEKGGEGSPPRLVLLWGGTVPVTLPDRLRALAADLRVFALTPFEEGGFDAALHEIGEVPRDAMRFALGRPLGEAVFEVLDHRLEPRPDFVPGPLYVRRAGERRRTGRLARYLPDGSIEHLGPEDEYTVDLFGYPAEPRQTEAEIERLPGVRIAVVRPVLDARGRRRLAAWAVLAEGAAADPEALRGSLGERLPSYLVPWRIRFLDELPLDAAGEVDRGALPSDGWTPDREPPSPGELEVELGRLWAEILGLAGEPGLEDNFFQAGGTSYTAVLLLGRIRERHGDVDLASFFYEPTFAHLADLVRSRPEEPSEDRAPAAVPQPTKKTANAIYFQPPTRPFTSSAALVNLCLNETLEGLGYQVRGVYGDGQRLPPRSDFFVPLKAMDRSLEVSALPSADLAVHCDLGLGMSPLRRRGAQKNVVLFHGLAGSPGQWAGNPAIDRYWACSPYLSGVLQSLLAMPDWRHRRILDPRAFSVVSHLTLALPCLEEPAGTLEEGLPELPRQVRAAVDRGDMLGHAVVADRVDEIAFFSILLLLNGIARERSPGLRFRVVAGEPLFRRAQEALALPEGQLSAESSALKNGFRQLGLAAEDLILPVSHLRQSALFEILRASRFGLFYNSFPEPFGFYPLESVLHGCPIYTNGIGNLRHLLPPGCGIEVYENEQMAAGNPAAYLPVAEAIYRDTSTSPAKAEAEERCRRGADFIRNSYNREAFRRDVAAELNRLETEPESFDFDSLYIGMSPLLRSWNPSTRSVVTDHSPLRLSEEEQDLAQSLLEKNCGDALEVLAPKELEVVQGLFRTGVLALAHPASPTLIERFARPETPNRRDQGDPMESTPPIPPLPLPPPPQQGMRAFLILWLGQLVSSLGTSLGSFTLGVWVYQKTGSATPIAMIAVVIGVIMLVLGPISGALADRWNRRKMMLFSNVGSAVMTLILASLMLTDRLEIWHIYPFVSIMVALSVLQGPAMIASISLLVPSNQLARAAGLSQVARGSTGIVGPFLAGVLVSAIGFHGVVLIDCATFLFAAVTLLLVPIPNPPRPTEVRRFAMLSDLAAGWTYLREKRGLFALLSMYTLTNFCMGIVQVLLTPLVLSFATPVELGSVNSAAAGGALLGGLALSFWGGPRNRIWTIFAILMFQGCLLFLGGVEPSIPLIVLATFGFMFTLPIIGGSNQAILQSKVAPEVQGRVFGMAAFLTACTVPLASAVAGPLVDRVFQPMLSPGGALADTFVGHLIGVGPGRGVGLLFVLLGIAVIIIVSLAFLNPRLRRVETDLPDAVRPQPQPPPQNA